MDKNMDFNSYSNPNSYNQFDSSYDTSMYETPMINPAMQYEQAYMYYRYLSQQMDYRIKCKEYEKLNKSN